MLKHPFFYATFPHTLRFNVERISAAAETIPVMVGGDAEYDACGGYGEVAGLKADGDGFLAVRKGPGTHYARIDKIHNGQGLSFCDNDGDWIGVVYTKKDTYCGVGSPIAKRQVYKGRCWSGWVHKNWVTFLAG